MLSSLKLKSAAFASMLLFIFLSVGNTQPIGGQITYYNNDGNAPLTMGCDSGEPIPDGYPYTIFWDRTNNGPDATDEPVPVGTGYGQANYNTAPFNLDAQGYGPGYFTTSLGFIIALPPNPGIGDFPAYYVVVNTGECCWKSTIFFLFSPVQQVFFDEEDWTCETAPCFSGQLPPPVTSFSATDGNVCLSVEYVWEHPGTDAAGFTIFKDGVLVGYKLRSAREGAVDVLDDLPHVFSIRAINQYGRSEPVTDNGSTYLRRFANGPTGDITGDRGAGQNFTLALSAPLEGRCPALITLNLLVNDVFFQEICTYDSLDSSTVTQLSCVFPATDQPLQNCRVEMVVNAVDNPQIFLHDTTVSYFNLNPLDADAFPPEIPNGIQLYANYPNPFNSTTTIRYDLPATMNVELSIFNVLGERVATLANGYQSSGTHSVQWGGRSATGAELATGIYICQIKTGSATMNKKMLLLK